MRRSAVVFLVLYLVLGALAAAVSNALVLTWGLLATAFLGPALAFVVLLPLAFAPAAFVYATALLPALFAYGFHLRARWVLVVAVVPVVLVALGPSALGRFVATVETMTLRGADFSKTRPHAPRSIELARRAPFYGGPDSALRDAPCFATCQKLLLNGEADRVVETAMSVGGSVVHRIGYTVERRPACPPAFADAKDALPETTAAAAHGTCIVPAVGDDGPVAVTVVDFTRYPHEAGFDGPPPLPGVTPASIRRLEIIDRTKATPAVVQHTTETRIRILAMPLLMLPESTGAFPEMALRWRRQTVVDNPIDFDDALRHAFSYRIAAITAFASEDSQSLLRLLLDRPGDQPIGADGQAALSDVMKSLAQREVLSEADVKLVGDVIADQRIDNVYAVGDVLSHHPELTPRVLAQIVARLEMPNTEYFNNSYSRLASEAMRLPAADLEPFAARLSALADSGAGWTWAIVARAGDITADPVPLLTRSLASKYAAFRRAAVTGICRLDPVQAAPLIEPLTQYLTDLDFKGWPPSDFVTGIIALRRFGHGDAADRLIAGLNEQQVKELDRDLGRRPAGNTVESCGTR